METDHGNESSSHGMDFHIGFQIRKSNKITIASVSIPLFNAHHRFKAFQMGYRAN